MNQSPAQIKIVAPLPARPKPCTVQIGRLWDGKHAIHRDAGTYSERGMTADHMSADELRIQSAFAGPGLQ